MNLERISEALQNYTGQEESMHTVANVLQEELGDNWTQTVFQDLQTLPPALKDNLTHAFNYYAATMAWNEIQGYLVDENLQKTPEIEERLPILKHWMDFFGEPGQAAYRDLESKLNGLTSEEAEPEPATEEGESETEVAPEEAPEELENAQEISEETEMPEEAEVSAELSEEKPSENEEEAPSTVVDENDPNVFEIQKIQKQIDLLEQNRAWLAARCIQLKDIEVYAYPFYGFIVDMMRQVIKGMNAILENEEAASLIENAFSGGRQAFDNKKQAIEHDIELAEQNCESAQTALISEDMDMDEVKRTLGAIDESDTVEYVGPAPDGFELLDDETPLDENAIKKQYEKLENMDAMTGAVRDAESTEPETAEENTSQKGQKGVQRKLSFSLKRKKPTGGES